MTPSFTVSSAFVVAIAAALLSLFSVPLAHAEDAAVEASASVEVSGEVRRPQPLKILNAEMREKRDAFRQEVDAKRDVVKAQLEQKRADVKAGVEARIGEKKERMASTSEMRKEKMEDRREHMASSSEARRADMKAKIEARAKQNIEMVVRNMVARLTAATERFDNIAARIDTRLEKLRSEGVDVSAATTLQATAKTKIADAKTAIAAIVKPSVSENATREEVKAAFEGIRANVKAAEEAVKAAHKALMEAVAAMKKAGGAAEASASAGASTSGN